MRIPPNTLQLTIEHLVGGRGGGGVECMMAGGEEAVKILKFPTFDNLHMKGEQGVAPERNYLFLGNSLQFKIATFVRYSESWTFPYLGRRRCSERQNFLFMYNQQAD